MPWSALCVKQLLNSWKNYICHFQNNTVFYIYFLIHMCFLYVFKIFFYKIFAQQNTPLVQSEERSRKCHHRGENRTWCEISIYLVILVCPEEHPPKKLCAHSTYIKCAPQPNPIPLPTTLCDLVFSSYVFPPNIATCTSSFCYTAAHSHTCFNVE